MVREDREVTIDPLFDRIDEQRLLSFLGCEEVGLAIASIELAKKHLGSLIHDPAVIAGGEAGYIARFMHRGE